MLITIFLSIILLCIKEFFVRIGVFLLKVFKFFIKIYKFYLFLILIAPVVIPLYIANNNYMYNIPSYIILYDLIFILGFIVYLYRTDEIKQKEAEERWREQFDRNYSYNLEHNKINHNYNNYNLKKNTIYNGLTKKDVQNKKKNIRKILEEKEMI